VPGLTYFGRFGMILASWDGRLWRQISLLFEAAGTQKFPIFSIQAQTLAKWVLGLTIKNRNGTQREKIAQAKNMIEIF
jgi:hypothetical protein